LKAKYYTATSVLEAWGEAKKWDVLHLAKCAAWLRSHKKGNDKESWGWKQFEDLVWSLDSKRWPPKTYHTERC
jgi:hypothetical protein